MGETLQARVQLTPIIMAIKVSLFSVVLACVVLSTQTEGRRKTTFESLDPFDIIEAVPNRRTQRQFDETTVAVPIESRTAVIEETATTTVKVKSTTEAVKTTTVKVEEEEPDYYEEVDSIPVTKKPLSAADKKWIQNILSKTTKAPTTTSTTTTTPTPTTPPPPPTPAPAQFRQPQF